MPIAPSQSPAGDFLMSNGGALNTMLNTHPYLDMVIHSVTAAGMDVTLMAKVVSTAYGSPPQPGYEGNPHGSGSVMFYDTGLDISSRSVTNNVAKITTVDPHGFEVGQLVGILILPAPSTYSRLLFWPFSTPVLEVGSDWFTYDATLPGGGPSPDYPETGTSGEVHPVLGSALIPTGTWDPDNYVDSSPAELRLTLPIPNALSDRWPSADGSWLHSILGCYMGTQDWILSVAFYGISWPLLMHCADMPIDGWANTALVPEPNSPPYDSVNAYTRGWYFGGQGFPPRSPDLAVFAIDSGTGSASPAKLTVTQRVLTGDPPFEHYENVSVAFEKSDGYQQNPIGSYVCTGSTPFNPHAVAPGTIVHVTYG